jgi:4-amino-4-deoxy-L-arabinose transferase-like glycosyltransferase
VDRARGAARFAAAWLATWAALALLHVTVLRLPYYWDEAGYYIPAAFDFFRWGTLIPRSTLTNAHPPLPSIYLAACWKLFGFHTLTTRLAVCAVSALALLAVYRIARTLVNSQTAFVVAALTAVYPVWFAQSTLAHADIFAAAATLGALAVVVRQRPSYGASALWFCIAALCKETAVVTPVALGAWLVLHTLRVPAERHANLRRACWMVAPVAVLSCWYLYHWRMTGFMFGNPEYLRYNATGTFHLARLWFALPHRFWHLAGHMNLWVAGLLSLAFWLLPVRADAPQSPLSRLGLQLLVVAFVGNALAFSILGGALLTRYLLPLFPLVLLFHVHFWRQRTMRWLLPVAVTAVAFILGWTVNPPYQFAAEDNLSYASAIRVQQHAIAYILQQDPRPTVLTAWPVADYLARPELGYVASSVAVVQVKDFTLPSLLEASHRRFTDALLFTTINPQRIPLSQRLFGHANREYFGLHDDVPPQMAARMLGGDLAWQQTQGRQYAGVIQENVPVDAMVKLPANVAVASLP